MVTELKNQSLAGPYEQVGWFDIRWKKPNLPKIFQGFPNKRISVHLLLSKSHTLSDTWDSGILTHILLHSQPGSFSWLFKSRIFPKTPFFFIFWMFSFMNILRHDLLTWYRPFFIAQLARFRLERKKEGKRRPGNYPCAPAFFLPSFQP